MTKKEEVAAFYKPNRSMYKDWLRTCHKSPIMRFALWLDDLIYGE